VAEADRFKLGGCGWEGVFLAGKLERHRHILVRGHGGQEVKGLKDDADPAPPRSGKAVFVERSEIGSGTRIVPDVARSSPESTAIRDDFPLPEGPSKATLSPLATCRSMPRRISTRAAPAPRARVTSLASMTI
jgi:hypothetical protein